MAHFITLVDCNFHVGIATTVENRDYMYFHADTKLMRNYPLFGDWVFKLQHFSPL